MMQLGTGSIKEPQVTFQSMPVISEEICGHASRGGSSWISRWMLVSPQPGSMLLLEVTNRMMWDMLRYKRTYIKLA